MAYELTYFDDFERQMATSLADYRAEEAKARAEEAKARAEEAKARAEEAEEIARKLELCAELKENSRKLEKRLREENNAEFEKWKAIKEAEIKAKKMAEIYALIEAETTNGKL